MKSTPTTRSVDFSKVYEPAEDSFLFLDALEEQSPYIQSRYQQNCLVLEIGPGSGIIITFVHKYILPNALYLTSDINVHACEASLTTSNENGGTLFLDTTRGDLATHLRPNLVDILLFNPPYVPDSESVPNIPADDDDNSWVDLALVGGKDGMEITNKLLDRLDSVLSPRGIAYILFCQRNNPESVMQRLKIQGWTAECVAHRKAGWEVLSIWRIERQS
jgi:release factor glutamine methyltransferase